MESPGRSHGREMGAQAGSSLFHLPDLGASPPLVPDLPHRLPRRDRRRARSAIVCEAEAFPFFPQRKFRDRSNGHPMTPVGFSLAESICLIAAAMVSVIRCHLGLHGEFGPDGSRDRIGSRRRRIRTRGVPGGRPVNHTGAEEAHASEGGSDCPHGQGDPVDRIRRLRRVSVEAGSGGPARAGGPSHQARTSGSPGRPVQERRCGGLPVERPAGHHPDGGFLPTHRG